MSAPTALYRRYRPDSFTDVIGQEHVTAPLMTALDKNRVNHAYLFSGPRGCGKTTSARILARCLNCAQGPTSHPCGTCDSCVELARGGTGSLDVIEIDAASHGGVDDARDLRERATFAPIRDRYKIFIIDEAHMVTSAGFNALLKIVEEPPEHIKFIFATTEPDKVIGTIRSRTHHYPFRLVPPEPLMAYLAQLCQRENVPVAPGVLSLVIRAGGGSVRDSLSVLDQLMAGAGAAGLDYELAVDLLGYTHASLLDDVVEALAAADSATVFKSVDRVIQTGHDPRRFVEDLLERFRDLIIVQAMPESAHAILRGTPDELIARMQTQAAQLGASELSRAADVTNTAFNEMTGATSPRLHLELLGARLLLPGADTSARGMAARLDQMERRLNYGGAPAIADVHAAAASATPAPSTTPSLADSRPMTPGGGLAAVRAQLAKAKAEAGAQVASRHQHGNPDAPEQGAPAAHAPEAPLPAAQPSAGAPPAPAGAAAPASASASSPAATLESRTPTWDDLEPAASTPPTAAQAAPAATDTVAGPGGHAASRAHAPEPALPAEPARAPQAPAALKETAGIEVIRRAWPEILGNLSSIRKVSWAMVNQNVVPRAFDGETLRVALPTTALIQAFSTNGHADNLRQAIHTTLGIACQLDPITGDAPDHGSSAEPNPKGLADPRLPGHAGRAPFDAPAPATPQAQAAAPAATRTPAPATASTPAPAPATVTDVPSTRPPLTELEAASRPAPPQPRPGAPVSDWDGPIPEEPTWADEPPHDDWTEQAYPDHGTPAAPPAHRGPQAGGASPKHGPAHGQGSPHAGDSSAVLHEHPETVPPGQTHPVRPDAALAIDGQTAPNASAKKQANEASGPAPEPAQSAAPYRPKISPISAWTSGWDTPGDPPAAALAPTPEEPAAPRRSQLLAAQARQNAQPDTQQQPPQDWGVSLGGPPRNNVADPGWGAPANAPDWAQPASSVSDASAAAGSAADSPAAGTSPAGNHAPDATAPEAAHLSTMLEAGRLATAPAQDGAAPVSAGTASNMAGTPAPSAGEKLSMYQRLSNSPEARAGRSQAPARAADVPFVEDVPSPDDVTIEESGVAGQAAVERILGGALIEERPLNGSSF